MSSPSKVPPKVVLDDESSSFTGRLTEVSFELIDVSFDHGNNPASTSSSGHGYNDPSSFSHQFNQGNDDPVSSLSVEVVVLAVVTFVDANPSLEGDMVGLTYTLDVTDTLNGSSVDTFTGASDDNVSCEASNVGSRLDDDDNVSSETSMVGSILASIGPIMGLSVPTTNSINGVGIIVGSSLIIPVGLGGLIIVTNGNVGSSVGVSVGSGSLIVGNKVGTNVGNGDIIVVIEEDGLLVGRGVLGALVGLLVTGRREGRLEGCLVGCFVVGLEVGADDGCVDGIIDG